VYADESALDIEIHWKAILRIIFHIDCVICSHVKLIVHPPPGYHERILDCEVGAQVQKWFIIVIWIRRFKLDRLLILYL
jgi:hypothetical protein